jgi:hypothetical protein
MADNQMDTSSQHNVNEAFTEWRFNDTRCRLLKRYTNIRSVGCGSGGLVMQVYKKNIF